jgi:SAM-dependent methyltransferase
VLSDFKEKDIRPEELMAGQKIAALTDVGRLLTRCSEFVSVACPACGGDTAQAKFTKNGMNYVSCTRCETFYVNPRPSPDVLAWFYRESPNYAYWNKHIFPASEAARRERIFVPRVDRVLDICRKYSVATDALLEVGAGFGTFCAEMNSRNVFKRVVGVEPTPGLANTCRERGIEVVEAPIEQVDFADSDRFDAVVSFEVIEHLFAPAEFVAHMLRMLKPGGLIVLTCPNGQGFDIEALGIASTSVDHEHLNYFNPKSLGRLLALAGMEILESFTPGKLDAELVRNAVLSGEASLQGQPLLNRLLFAEWDQHGSAFQQFLAERGLSSNLWVVARKPGSVESPDRSTS